MNEWISVEDRLPERTGGKLTSIELLFVVDGKTYPGYYHVNGCFYSSSKIIAAKTVIPNPAYSRWQLPKAVATHWQPLPDPPEVADEKV